MKAIGGFYDIELPAIKRQTGYHPEAIGLSTGRACLALALEDLKPAVCYVPYYCCDALFDPVVAIGSTVVFYEINENLEPIDPPAPGPGELFIYTNFFGLKNDYSEKLSSTLEHRVLIDDTHRFFYHGYPNSYSFTSARKYFGVPDGAYLYSPKGTTSRDVLERNNKILTEHLFARLLNRDEEALALFQKNETKLNSDIIRMSQVSERLLATIDYEFVEERRRDNYDYLSERLGATNRFTVEGRGDCVPFCYPYLPDPPILHEKFYSQCLYPPKLWPDPLARKARGFEYTRKLCRDLLPLPVDHRYDREDLGRLVRFIESHQVS